MTQDKRGLNDEETTDITDASHLGSDNVVDMPVATDLDLVSKERDKWKSDFLYLKAEFDNYKRNAIKERAETMKYGSERVIVDFLQAMDNMDRALQMEINEKNVASFRKGMEMVANEMKSIFQRFGVTEVPSQGEAFDPNIHEALTSEDSEDVPAGHITKVFRKPYKLHDKVIRTGQVVVAREPAN